MSYMVFSKGGKIWPPGFKSELCSPESPHSMLSVKAKSLAAAGIAGAQARAAGLGWGAGTIPHLVKPIIPQAKRVRVG